MTFFSLLSALLFTFAKEHIFAGKYGVDVEALYVIAKNYIGLRFGTAKRWFCLGDWREVIPVALMILCNLLWLLHSHLQVLKHITHFTLSVFPIYTAVSFLRDTQIHLKWKHSKLKTSWIIEKLFWDNFSSEGSYFVLFDNVLCFKRFPCGIWVNFQSHEENFFLLWKIDEKRLEYLEKLSVQTDLMNELHHLMLK